MPELSYKSPFLMYISGSLEDFYSLKNIKAEYYEGMIMAQSSATVEHEECFIIIVNQLYNYIKKYELGKVIGSRLLISFGENQKFEPDIVFVSHQNSGRFGYHEFEGVPDLIFEIVSDTTKNYDFTIKRDVYKLNKVPEICFYDLSDYTITIDVLEGKNYISQKIKSERHPSKVIKGFFWDPYGWMKMLKAEL
ncbi:MAG: hypothetical protein A2X61_06685 [Ignavibacteria bacterium GWB2_35_12]|nr:MAG: hypothetical protein A2X63_02690 [Ignavibacteria bacterium GWA2_35_8]OGU38626.1 MAG: hypothetical protein A2X61_06685 [Ignavibacteria bacterium GWB2_35_12]OGU93972.1 MAG: hypothetical protein A2220_04430 [Ignavibacteria bacterium RIFOXYA2_FULL_35_10]OGV22829.1 MAG: hypothetical protein A2475_02270 [Ignavibacteria bacterium RIFOXYC2_FULL_35_21]